MRNWDNFPTDSPLNILDPNGSSKRNFVSYMKQGANNFLVLWCLFYVRTFKKYNLSSATCRKGYIYAWTILESFPFYFPWRTLLWIARKSVSFKSFVYNCDLIPIVNDFLYINSTFDHESNLWKSVQSIGVCCNMLQWR